MFRFEHDVEEIFGLRRCVEVRLPDEAVVLNDNRRGLGELEHRGEIGCGIECLLLAGKEHKEREGRKEEHSKPAWRSFEDGLGEKPCSGCGESEETETVGEKIAAEEQRLVEMRQDGEGDRHEQKKGRDVEKKREAVGLSALPSPAAKKPDTGVDGETEKHEIENDAHVAAVEE